MNEKYNLTGKVFGRLTVIKQMESKIIGSKKHRTWECLCECGKHVVIRAELLKNGSTKSCGCLAKEASSKNAQKMIAVTKKYTPIIAAARYAWRNRYQKEISFEDFYQISQNNCYYCGAKPSNVHNLSLHGDRSEKSIKEGVFIYSGLDRIDSDLGHAPENVVPCCWVCNRAKRERSVEEFMTHADKLISKKETRLSPEQYRQLSLEIDMDRFHQQDQYAYRSTVRGKLRSYGDGNLDIIQFYRLSQMHCYYCGDPPGNLWNNSNSESSLFAKISGNFIYNGIDRVDNDLVHDYDNVVLSCKWCNWAKQTLMLEEFDEWIERLKIKKNQK